MIEKLFKLNENGTTVKTEVIGGLNHLYDDGIYPCCQPKSFRK